MGGLAKKLLASAGGSVAKDPYFKDTVLLLNGDDAVDGKQNNTFLDSSVNNLAISAFGNVSQGSFSPFSKEAGKWGVSFDGSGDYLTVPTIILDGDFTVELWFYQSATVSSYLILTGYGTSSSWLGFTSNNTTFTVAGYNGLIAQVAIPSGLNKWTHYAVTKAGSIWRLFVDGVQYGGDLSNTLPLCIDRIGAYGTQYNPNGYISNLRVVKGTALYTANFTPPTSPLTAVAGTSLLCCQDNQFKDNSANNFTLTPNGNVAVTPFSPFANSAAYRPVVNGGSGYFNSSYLRVASGVLEANGDVTIEAWIYPFTTLVDGLFDGGPNQTNIIRNHNNQAGVNKFSRQGQESTGATFTVKPNSWQHLAVTYSSGVIRVFVDGILAGTGSYSSGYSAGSNFTVGSINNTYSYFNGIIGEFRVVKSVIYTTNFTPPTGPLTPITNTSLLLNFTNAGIYDNTGMNNIETVGNARVSTSVKKYGTGAMYFDGSGDYLTFARTEAFNFSTGDFTVEAWVYPTVINSIFDAIFSISGTSGNWNATGNGMVISVAILSMASTATNGVAYSSSVSANTWSHLAVSRSGSTVRVFINGTTVLTHTNSVAIGGTTNGNPTIGVFDGGTRYPFTGYIDDLRITKGVARYTANFTPPNEPLPIE